MTTNQQENYLLWRLGGLSQYAAMAYTSTDFVAGGALPRYFITDQATFGPEGSEDDRNVYYVLFREPGNSSAVTVAGVQTLIAGIREAEKHWKNHQGNG
ncbi:MAG: hypothetical protein OXE87_04980 [Chloroflexi bacterium]|nr:hypothetical protein [Chloroflexota bacterium]